LEPAAGQCQEAGHEGTCGELCRDWRAVRGECSAAVDGAIRGAAHLWLDLCGEECEGGDGPGGGVQWDCGGLCTGYGREAGGVRGGAAAAGCAAAGCLS